jgi:hypothetical protein
MILDHLDQLHISDTEASAHTNVLRSLDYLREGLMFLNGQVTRLEEMVFDRLDPAKVEWFFGNAPHLEGVPQGLVACSFHWYAVSACNFVRLSGWLTHGQDTKKANKYVERVMPEVKLWRDKVAAHFAITDPRPGGKYPDNPADLVKSVMFPIAWNDRAFWTNSLQLSIGTGTQVHSSRSGMDWSLTETHQKLSERFWPSGWQSTGAL